MLHSVYREITHNTLKNPDYMKDGIVEFLKLEPFEDGYIKYLDGLCALEQFKFEPKYEDCTKMIIGDNREPHLFKYLVCFEGEEVGEDKYDDWGQEWKLFKPKRIIWVRETGFSNKRNKNK